MYSISPGTYWRIFFEDYALEKKPDGSHKGWDTIEKCIATVTRFMANLARKFGGT